MNEYKHLKHEQHICRFMHDNNNSTEQMLLPKKLHFPVERGGANRCVGFIEGIHRKLHVEIINIIKEVLDSVLLPDIMEHKKSHMRSCDKGRHEPFVELVHSLQVHVVGLPHVLIHQIQRRMRDELVQVSVVILRLGLSWREKLHLKHRVIVMTHHNEIKTPRHR